MSTEVNKSIEAKKGTQPSRAGERTTGKKRVKSRKRSARPYRHCGNPACRRRVSKKPVPNGTAPTYCSSACRKHRENTIQARCEHCNVAFLRPQWRRRNSNFCSQEHFRLNRIERVLGATGPFRQTIEEYLKGTDRYRKGTMKTVQAALGNFFSFVVQNQKIYRFEDIRPRIVTRFIAQERDRGIKNRNFIGYLRMFFNWLQAEERVDMTNPFVLGIHTMQINPGEPRPYDEAQVDAIWGSIKASGDVALMLAYSIGLECGLRVGEVANIRLEDVNREKQTIYVRLPTKNMRPREVPFHDGVMKYLDQWLELRRPEFRTDHLLHGKHLGIFDTSSLDGRFKTVLKRHHGPAANFKFHRLRHTWATRLLNNGMELATLKELGGWESWSSMQRYIKVLPETVKRQYAGSYQRIQEKQQAEPENVISLMDFALMSSADYITPKESMI
jgi:integrase